VRCRECDGPIENPNEAVPWVWTYDPKRADGGRNGLIGRKETGEFAHRSCVRLIQLGVSRGQGELL
jgi:hypothetical protein